MKKIFLLFATLAFLVGAFAQTGYVVLKKRKKPLRYFWRDGHFTFQMIDGEWLTGIITHIKTDSFYLTQEIIHYNAIGTDTLRLSGGRFSIADVYALPTKKEEIVFDNDRVRVTLGHEKFVWVRNGFIFQVAGAGYVGLNVINDLARNDPPFAKNKLSHLGAGVLSFLVGTLLHMKFDPFIHLGKKYHLESVPLPEAKH